MLQQFTYSQLILLKRQRDDLAGFVGLVDGEDDFDGFPALFAVDVRFAIVVQRVQEIDELAAVAFMADGCRVGCTASGLCLCSEFFQDFLIFGSGVGEFPSQDVRFLEDDRAAVA